MAFYHIALKVDSRLRLPNLYANCPGTMSVSNAQTMMDTALAVSFYERFRTDPECQLMPAQFKVVECAKAGSIWTVQGDYVVRPNSPAQWFSAELRVPRGKPTQASKNATFANEQVALDFVDRCKNKALLASYRDTGWVLIPPA